MKSAFKRANFVNTWTEPAKDGLFAFRRICFSHQGFSRLILMNVGALEDDPDDNRPRYGCMLRRRRGGWTLSQIACAVLRPWSWPCWSESTRKKVYELDVYVDAGRRRSRGNDEIRRIYPELCVMTPMTDDDLANPLGYSAMHLDSEGMLNQSDESVTEAVRMVKAGRWVVWVVRASADAATQLEEPIDSTEAPADPTPENWMADPRFDYIHRCADYTIQCRGGRIVAASRHILALRSRYFLRLLTDPATAETQAALHYLDFTADLVSLLITYVHTGTYGIHPGLPLRRMLEFLRLVRLIQPSERFKLEDRIGEELRRCFEKATDPTHREVYNTLDDTYDYPEMDDAHDEHLLRNMIPFRPTDYIEKMRRASFGTQLFWSQD